MNKVYTIFASILISLNIFAQSPEKMSYQAVIRNAENNLVTNQQVGMQISILQGADANTTTTIYLETQIPTTNANGLVTIEVGTGTSSDDFSVIDWGNGTFFIKSETDLTGGTDYTITGISQLLSVPYALFATKAGNVPDISNLAEQQALADSASSIRSSIPNIDGILVNEQAIKDSAIAIRADIPDISSLAKKQELIDSTNAIKAQIPDVSSFLSEELDPFFSEWDKSYKDLTNVPNIMDSIINVVDTTTQFLRSEVDGSTTNEIQTISRIGLTVILTDGGTYQDSVNTQNLASVLAENNDAGNQNITNLANPINNQDAATKAYVDELLNEIEQLQLATGIKIKDYDGNIYKTVTIGAQTWLAENLRVTHYPDGTEIPKITDGEVWSNLTDIYSDDAYCWYNNDSATYSKIYGALYTYAAASKGEGYSTSNPSNIQGVCPSGWHIPSSTEWMQLQTYLGGEDVAGGKMKEAGVAHWNSPNTGAINESGFSALPAGFRYTDGNFSSEGQVSYLWSCTEDCMPCGPSNWWLHYSSSGFYHGGSSYHNSGYSVRCVKD